VQSVPILYNGTPLLPSKLPLPMGNLDPHLIHGSVGSPKSSTPTASRSVQPFFAGLTSVTDDRPHYSVGNNNTAVQPNNAHIITRVSFRQVSVAECQMSIWVFCGSLCRQVLSVAISWRHIAQGRVAMYLMCGRIFSHYFAANLMLNQPLREFWKMISLDRINAASFLASFPWNAV